MSQSKRKPRPLDRSVQQYRDDRLYIVASDDSYAPDQYFSAYRQDFIGTRLQVHVVKTEDGTSSAVHVLERLLEYEAQENDQRWLLLDTDHYTQGSHLKSFTQTLQRAREHGVHVALNKPCFEYWLLLHPLSTNKSRYKNITDAKSAESALKQLLGSYNKTNLNMEHFPLKSVPDAIAEAQEIDAPIKGREIPNQNTARIYLLWEEMVRNASLAQLPAELQELKSNISK